jgi:CheY-like chemotaxis protein
MYILVVEDQFVQADLICENLEKEFPDSVIEQIDTESEFRYRLDAIAMNPPDVIVMDVMLPWTEPDPVMPPTPEDVLNAGFNRAGLRCAKLLAENDLTKGIPVIVYTVLEEFDLERELRNDHRNVVYLRKDSDPDPLFKLIHELTDSRRM